MTYLLDRRKLLAAGLGSMATASLANMFGPLSSIALAADKTINVTQFGGPFLAIRKIVGEPFQASNAGKVTYGTENSVSAMSKLQTQAKNPPFDVVQFSRGFSLRAGSAGLLRPFGVDELPNAGDLIDGAVSPGRFGVAMIVDNIDVMYNKDKSPIKIESWLDLWRPELKGKIAMPSASLPIYFTVMAIARALTGKDNTEKAIDDAFKKLAELKDNVRVWYSDPVIVNRLLEKGDVAVALQFGARMSHLIKKNPKIARSTPKEGIPAIPYDLAIPKHGKHHEVAVPYVNLAISKAINQELGRALLINPAHKEATLSDDIKPLVADRNAMWFPDEVFAGKNSRVWSRRWQREVQS